MARRTAPPPDLGAAGADLWRSCLIRDDALCESANPMRSVLLEACKVADQADKLHEIVVSEGVMSGNRVHPALIAWRKSTALLPRLLASLRMPDPITGKRPQRRGFRIQRPTVYR